nr:hypothetical protein [Tanacetum cinerariifolium]
MSQMRSEGEESESLFFEVDGSSSDECGDYGVAGNDYEGPSVFDDDQYEEKIITLNVDFEEDFNTKSQELMSFGKSIIIKVKRNSLIRKKYQEWYFKAAPIVDKFGFKTIKVR